jgi:DNA-directed RNA polymerase subunit alpha
MTDGTDWFAVPLSTLGLSLRGQRILARLGVTTVGDVCQYSIAEILPGRSFGEITITELEMKLADRGLRLRDDKAGPCVVRQK